MKLNQRLFLPTDNIGLVLFRIAFGFLMCFHCIDYLADGSVFRLYIEPPFTFNFIGFDFLQPLPGNGMYYYFGLMALLGILIMIGYRYRLVSTLFALLWTALYLMQKSGYNNHHYLVLLISWLMVLMPANRNLSVDAYLNKSIKTDYCEQWIYWLFIIQIGIVYFFAAASKLTPDWYSGKFIEIRFSRWSMHPSLGFIYGNKLFQLFISYAGIVFDFLIVPLLLWRRTRALAVIASILFHLFNSFTFHIGIFPYLSIAFLLLFIDPATLRKVFLRNNITTLKAYENLKPVNHKIKLIFFYSYLLVQLLMPMRYLMYPGNVFWTEEGYRMSWKMMLRTKSGTVYFRVKDPVTKQEWKEEPGKIFQLPHMMWLSGSPDIIWQYAQRLKRSYQAKGIANPEVYAIGKVSMNRKPAQALVDSTINLAAEKWQPFTHSAWIVPFAEK